MTACKLIKIKDDYEYHRAHYGDLNVIMIKSKDHRDGWINVTKLCQEGGKEFKEWKRLKRSKELIEYHENLESKNYSYPVSSIFLLDLHGSNETDRLISGTYIHYDIVHYIISWISIEHVIKISKLISNNHRTIMELENDIKIHNNNLNKVTKEIKFYIYLTYLFYIIITIYLFKMIIS